MARHGVRLRALDPRCPLQVGNGEFAFAVDPTGMQTFPDAYPVAGGGSLLGTMAQWAWHSLPAPRPYSLGETLREYDTPRGPVPYVDLSNESHDAASQTDAETWLRGNPHKLQLATIGLWVPSSPLDVAALTDVDQHLDLWSGTITSRFRLGGARYTTITAVHPERDAVAIDVTGPPAARLGVRLRFPYGSDAWADACDWSRSEAHTTRLERMAQGWRIVRQLDGSVYVVIVHAHADGGEAALEVELRAEHELVFGATGALRVVIEFLPGEGDEQGALAAGTVLSSRRAVSSRRALDPFRALDTRHALDTRSVTAASASSWADFWSSGACVDLSGSTDPRAHELERRIVLSQYLTAINCAGSVPPAETGLLLNSWRGKFHLEMHLFHGLHFAAWGRPRLLERSLGWYQRVLGPARQTAANQGHAGARWPKQVGPDGRETPSSIGPFLVWQQPHLIYLLEMLYRADPDSDVLERYGELIFATAEFM
ncbi:MAG TPA: hypothetical protein VFN03_02300, partial [Trueperaceae bacterium]|nr:hypothetical protein [Trueperaceae bacterium]